MTPLGWQRLIRAYHVLGEDGRALNALATARNTFAGNRDALTAAKRRRNCSLGNAGPITHAAPRAPSSRSIASMARAAVPPLWHRGRAQPIAPRTCLAVIRIGANHHIRMVFLDRGQPFGDAAFGDRRAMRATSTGAPRGNTGATASIIARMIIGTPARTNTLPI